MSKLVKGIVLTFAAITLNSSLFAKECPPAVRAAVVKAHPGAQIAACKEETEQGKLQYEVNITTKQGKKMDIDVSPEGTILLTEVPVTGTAVPDAVMKALDAKYPGAKVLEAMKQTAADGKVSYELSFKSGNERNEQTFISDGTLVEEKGEAQKDDDDDDD